MVQANHSNLVKCHQAITEKSAYSMLLLRLIRLALTAQEPEMFLKTAEAVTAEADATYVQ